MARVVASPSVADEDPIWVIALESDLREPCNLGNPSEQTILELAERVNRIIGNASGIEHKPLPTDDPTRRRPDIGRAMAELGWTPKTSFEQGLAETIAWFAAQP